MIIILLCYYYYYYYYNYYYIIAAIHSVHLAEIILTITIIQAEIKVMISLLLQQFPRIYCWGPA